MNEVHLSGRLTTDPKITYTAKKMCVAKYNLAVSRDFKQKDGGPDADFPTCIAFGKQGEFAEKYLKKGMKMIVSGRLQTGNYTDKDGRKVYTTEVVVAKQEFAESKASQQSQQREEHREPIPAQDPAPAPMNQPWMEIPDDIGELPFA